MTKMGAVRQDRNDVSRLHDGGEFVVELRERDLCSESCDEIVAVLYEARGSGSLGNGDLVLQYCHRVVTSNVERLSEVLASPLFPLFYRDAI